MPNAYAISTGAQLLEDEMTLTFDVLIIDPSLEWGATYFASSVPVLADDDPATLRIKVSEKILTDGVIVTGLEIPPQDLTIPSYDKGIVSTTFEYPDPPVEEPPAEEPPAEDPPAEDPPAEDPVNP